VFFLCTRTSCLRRLYRQAASPNARVYSRRLLLLQCCCWGWWWRDVAPACSRRHHVGQSSHPASSSCRRAPLRTSRFCRLRARHRRLFLVVIWTWDLLSAHSACVEYRSSCLFAYARAPALHLYIDSWICAPCTSARRAGSALVLVCEGESWNVSVCRTITTTGIGAFHEPSETVWPDEGSTARWCWRCNDGSLSTCISHCSSSWPSGRPPILTWNLTPVIQLIPRSHS